MIIIYPSRIISDDQVDQYLLEWFGHRTMTLRVDFARRPLTTSHYSSHIDDDSGDWAGDFEEWAEDAIGQWGLVSCRFRQADSIDLIATILVFSNTADMIAAKLRFSPP